MTRPVRLLMILVLCFVLPTSFLGCASSSSASRQTPGQYVDDSLITTKVKTAILKEPTLKVLQINVGTYQGKVQLSGFVNSSESARRAEELARGVEGVNSVENNLIVK